MSETTETKNEVNDTTMEEEKPKTNAEQPKESNSGTSEKEDKEESSTEKNNCNDNETKDVKKEVLTVAGDEKKEESQQQETKKKEVSKEILEKIGERLQFFFSDVNLRSDRFMNQTMKNNKNMIPLQVMGRFKTIQQYSSDPSIIKEAAKAHCSDFLLVDENGVGRITPYDYEKGRGNDVPLTLFVDNLPVFKSGTFYDCTVREVIDTFKDYGKIALVRLRYTKEFKKHALGSAFVEFATKEEFENAKKDLVDGETPNRTLVLKGKDLKIKTMQDWMDRARNNRGNNDNRTEANDEESQDEKLNDKDEDITSFEKGGVITLKGVADDCSRESILSAIQEFSYIWKVSDDNAEEKKKQNTLPPLAKRNVYIDYSRNQPDGAIRFTNVCISEHRDKIAELANKLKLGEIKISDKAVEDAFVLEGGEEEQYWKKVMQFQKMKNLHQKRKKNFGGYKKPYKRQRRS